MSSTIHTQKKKRKETINVAILAVEGTHSSSLYGAKDMLHASGIYHESNTQKLAMGESINPIVVGKSLDPVIGWNNVKIFPEKSISNIGPIEAILIVSLGNPVDEIAPIDSEVVAWIKHQYDEGTIIATSCNGIWPAAQAGILDGQQATMHWACSEQFRIQYPKVILETKRALAFSGQNHQIISSGGGSLWIELVLYLISRLAGQERAVQLANLYMVNWARDGQVPYAFVEESLQHEDRTIKNAQAYLTNNFFDFEALAKVRELSGLSNRTFERRFKSATGISPVKYIQQTRIEKAKKYLSESNYSIDEIGFKVGYMDSTSFRRLFKRFVGSTPASYRKCLLDKSGKS